MNEERFGIEPVVNVPKVNVLDEDGNVLLIGYYIRHESRQPAVFDDELKPSDVQHIVAYSESADWNMPRDLRWVEVTPPHRIEIEK